MGILTRENQEVPTFLWLTWGRSLLKVNCSLQYKSKFWYISLMMYLQPVSRYSLICHSTAQYLLLGLDLYCFATFCHERQHQAGFPFWVGPNSKRSQNLMVLCTQVTVPCYLILWEALKESSIWYPWNRKRISVASNSSVFFSFSLLPRSGVLIHARLSAPKPQHTKCNLRNVAHIACYVDSPSF